VGSAVALESFAHVEVFMMSGESSWNTWRSFVMSVLRGRIATTPIDVFVLTSPSRLYPHCLCQYCGFAPHYLVVSSNSDTLHNAAVYCGRCLEKKIVPTLTKEEVKKILLCHATLKDEDANLYQLLVSHLVADT